MKQKTSCVGILLSGGRGKRAGGSVPKQYRELDGRPLIYYGLKAFEECDFIDEVLLVVGEEEGRTRSKEIVEKYGFQKVSAFIIGGEERYHSVWNALQYLKGYEGYVFIQDGARPFLNQKLLKRGYDAVKKYRACVAGVPTKDTIKKVNEEGRILETPARQGVRNIQTPQVFESALLFSAYERLMKEQEIDVTDDSSVLEKMGEVPVFVFEGEYENIKVTTQEDFAVAESLWKRLQEKECMEKSCQK